MPRTSCGTSRAGRSIRRRPRSSPLRRSPRRSPRRQTYTDTGVNGVAWLYGVARHQLGRFFRAGRVDPTADAAGDARALAPARGLRTDRGPRRLRADPRGAARSAGDPDEDQREAMRLHVIDGLATARSPSAPVLRSERATTRESGTAPRRTGAARAGTPAAAEVESNTDIRSCSSWKPTSSTSLPRNADVPPARPRSRRTWDAATPPPYPERPLAGPRRGNSWSC